MKSLWPRWIPYPVSIVRATVVCGTFILVVRLGVSSISEESLYWYYSDGQIPDELKGAVALGRVLILPVVAFLHHWISGVLEEKYYQSHHPFIPSRKSWGEGVTALLVASVGFLIVNLLFSPNNARNFWLVGSVWFTSIAFVYHLGYILNEWRADRKAIKAERKAARRKANEEARAAKERAKAEKRALKSRSQQRAIAPSTEAVFDDMLRAIAEKEKRGRRR